MKKLLLTFFALSSSLLAFSQGTWTSRDTLPNDSAMCQGISGFSIGSYGYAGLGEGTGSSPEYNDLWQFNPSNNSWIKKAFFPGTARVAPACFVICDKAYLICGSVKNAGTCVNECWEYDATNNIWTQKANFPGPARVYAVGFAIDSLGYVGTGADELSDFRKDFYAYHPSTDTWTKIADFPGIARSCANGFAVNGKGYVCFGQDSLFSGSWLKKDMWEYNPVANTWMQKSNCPGFPMYCASGFAICNNIYVGSGSDSDVGFSHTFWKYNTITNTWTQEASIPGITKIEATAFAVNDTGYYGFGIDSVGDVYNKFYKFFAGDTCLNLNACPGNGIELLQNDLSFSVYPNPTNKLINLNFSNQIHELVTCSIMDITGREVINSQFSNFNSQFSVDVSSLTPGMYFIRLKINFNYITQKFIKQ